MKAEKVGCFYNRHGEIYRLVGYNLVGYDRHDLTPTLTFQNVENLQRITAAAGDPQLSEFKEIVTKEKV